MCFEILVIMAVGVIVVVVVAIAAINSAYRHLIVAIVHYLYGWGVLTCFCYTAVEFVYFFVQIGITGIHLLLDDGRTSSVPTACGRCKINRSIRRYE